MVDIQKLPVTNLKEKAILFLATGGWIGYSPVAPGTIGSLAALPLCLLIASMSIRSGLIVLMALVTVSTWLANEAEKTIGQFDPKQVVIDEISGITIALFALPFEPFFVIWGFALFRLFDILKPFPIGWIDKRVSGGLGIMLDDVIAGLLANLLLRIGTFIC